MWVHSFVPKLQVGEGALADLGESARPFGNRAVLVVGRHTLATGVADRAQRSLRAAGIDSVTIEGPAGEPSLTECARGLAEAREASGSLVIGIGGGSVLDMAKCVAGLFFCVGDPQEVVSKALYDGPGGAQALPWIAVPTTAGTGSEATHVTVLSDSSKGVKQSMRCDQWYARAVLIDPTLYVSAPPHVTAASGMDALTQAIESHVSRGATPVTQALSRQATRLLATNLLAAYHDGKDLKARRATAIGSFLAGVALTNARLGLVHGLAHPVGIRYGLPHGQACAMLLPSVIRFNLAEARSGYAELAAAIGLTDEGDTFAAERLLSFVEQLNAEMEIPSTLQTTGMVAKDIPALAEATLASASTKANPRQVSQPEAEELLVKLL